MLYIKADNVLTPAGLVPHGAVLSQGEQIVAVGSAGEVACPPSAQVIEASGLLLAPGFIDLQINGALGHDFTDSPYSIWEVATRLPEYGVTSFLPTIITSPLETVAEAQKAIRSEPPAGFQGADPIGLHLEGPFLNPAKRGAHNPDYLRPPDLSAVREWSPEKGVRFVTLAPELPGALELVHALTPRGVVVSAGHSMATLEQAREGFEAGISYGTHLFNAMPPLDHREPGLAGALLTAPDIVAGAIVDGIHLHPDVVALAWKAKGPGTRRVRSGAGLNLITDAMAALGMPPGNYRLGDRDVATDGSSCRLVDGTLAGSVLSLDQAVRNLVAFTGCDPAEAIDTVTAVPTSLLRLHDRGRIAPGMRADLVLLTSDLRVAATIVRGEIVYSAREARV